MTSINTRIGASSTFRTPPNTHADPAPAEQQETSPKKPDKQASSSHHVGSGPKNLQRFGALHGNAGKAGIDDGTPVYAGPGAESSDVRRRALRVQGGNPANRAGDASEASRMRRRSDPSLAGKWGFTVLKGLVSALALLAGYRFVRNPGDFARYPMAALEGVLNFNNVNAQALQNAQHAVLEKFGSYIPADSDCYHVRAEVVSFDTQGANIPPDAVGIYNREKNWLRMASYLPREMGFALAIHEYCHCFSHPQFDQTLRKSPNYLNMIESLTEHISNKIPAKGQSQIKTLYDEQEMENEKKMLQAAQEMENAVGEATLMRAYFKGDKAAIRKLSRAAVDIYPKRVSASAWRAALAVGGKEGSRQLAECFVAASLLSEGKLPSISVDSFAQLPGSHLSVRRFSDINSVQQKALIEQGKKARERLGPKFDQAFYNFDEEAAKQAIKAVREDLLANWKPVLAGKPFFEQ